MQPTLLYVCDNSSSLSSSMLNTHAIFSRQTLFQPVRVFCFQMVHSSSRSRLLLHDSGESYSGKLPVSIGVDVKGIFYNEVCYVWYMTCLNGYGTTFHHAFSSETVETQ